jgi:hypothetical protein
MVLAAPHQEVQNRPACCARSPIPGAVTISRGGGRRIPARWDRALCPGLDPYHQRRAHWSPVATVGCQTRDDPSPGRTPYASSRRAVGVERGSAQFWDARDMTDSRRESALSNPNREGGHTGRIPPLQEGAGLSVRKAHRHCSDLLQRKCFLHLPFPRAGWLQPRIGCGRCRRIWHS